MVGSGNTPSRSADKADRRASRDLIAAYHQSQLRTLLEHVRVGFSQLDAGEIDEFDMDDLIHHYKRSAGELWKFCGSSGGQWQRAAIALTYLREQGDEPDWWGTGRSSAQRNALIRVTPASIGGRPRTRARRTTWAHRAIGDLARDASTVR